MTKLAVTPRYYKRSFGLFICFALAYSLAVPLITMDICLSDFNDVHGLQIQNFDISTRFSRYFELDNVCPQGEICQLYATLPEDGATSVILNIHTGTDVDTLIVNYDTLENVEDWGENYILPNNVTAQTFHIDLETRGDRNMHSAYLSGLKPNTMYFLKIIFNDQVQRTTKYQTLPDEKLERNIMIATGGDVGVNKQAEEMTNVLLNYPIDVVTIGGDMAYDNGLRSCYYLLDVFIRRFEPLNEERGRLIPLLISIGNHDVGVNAYSNRTFDKVQNLYYNYFPQHSALDSQGTILNKVTEFEERLPYSYHTIGNTVHTILDSAYEIRYEGAQSDFISNVSEKYPNLVKMANFHVPMYPACFGKTNRDPRTLTEARAFWGSLFEKYKFSSVFENHVHVYKKTYPVLDGKANPGGKGVTYFGDGNWGVPPYNCKYNGNDTGIMEAYGKWRHIWLVNVTKDVISHFAVNQFNKIFDKVYNLNVTDYV